MQEKLIIKTHDGKIYRYTPLKKNDSGKLCHSSLEKSFFTEGGSCRVFLAVNDDDGRKYLIKQYKNGFSGDKSSKIISDVIRRYNEQGDNYILEDVHNGTGHLENSNNSFNYKVFDYREGHVLSPYKGEVSIFSNYEALNSILLDFASLLNSLKLLHNRFSNEGTSYLHCDIKPENTFALNISGKRIVQPIDFDSLRSVHELVNAIENGEELVLQSTAEYYTNKDICELCKLKGDDLRKYIGVLDTTAAVKIFSYMLLGNTQFSLSPEDQKAYDKNESLQTALNRFFEIGLSSFLTERFCTVEEMIERVSAIIFTISSKLPQTVQSQKLLAISQNRHIKDLRYAYQKKYDSENEVFVFDLLRDICPTILPYIQKKGYDDRIEGSANETPLAVLLRENRNYIITAEGGSGKTTSLLLEFLKNVQSDNNELYIYVSLASYKNDYPIEDFVSLESGFDFNNLINNKENKITLLLDAMDEIGSFREANTNEKKEFLEGFFQKLSVLQNVRIIITSRILPNIIEVAEKKFFGVASFLPLTDAQIKDYLNIDQTSYEEICRNNSLQTLLKNSFMLNIYKKMNAEIADDTQITSAAELLDLYFLHMYESKNKKEGLRDNSIFVFNEYMDSVSKAAFHEEEEFNSYLNEAKNVAFLLDISQCYAPIIDLHREKDTWKISFSHLLFKEYFFARYLFAEIKKMFKKARLGEKDINVLYRYCSYQTLIFVSQMLSSEKPFDLHIKKQLELLFNKLNKATDQLKKTKQSEYQKRLDSDETDLNAEWMLRIDKQICRKECASAVVLCIIAFWINFDLSKIDFGDYFYNNRFPRAFSYCQELEHIILPPYICGIDHSTFEGCRNLTNIEMPEAFVGDQSFFMRVGDKVFSKCQKLRTIGLPHGTSELPCDMFKSCYNLDTVYLPSTIKRIHSGAFKYCRSLRKVVFAGTKEQWFNIPKSGSWRYCSGRFDIICSDGIYDQERFLENGLEIVEEGNELCIKSVGHCAEKNITIPDNIDRINARAFEDCDDIVSIAMNVKTIENNAFECCYSLTNIKIGSRLTTVKGNSFLWVAGRRSVSFDGKLKDWCSIVFDGECSNPCYENGLLFFENELVTSVYFDATFSEIKPYAFLGCDSLQKVSISKEIKRIGIGAFNKCSNLTSIKFLGSVAEWEKIEKNWPNGDYPSDAWYRESGINCVICDDGIVEVSGSASDYFLFKLNPDRETYSVIGIASNYKGTRLDVQIPHYYKGLPVTKLNDFASLCCVGCFLHIPNTIIEIGEKAINSSFFFFKGTKNEWLNILKAPDITGTKGYIVQCFDGTIQSKQP